jgi:putative endonuclease
MLRYDVYIVQCSDRSYYTGITNDIERRVGEHNAGIDPKSYTHSRRPVKLVYVSEFWDVWQALDWEKKVKRWSRAKKEALIRGEYEKLPGLSKKDFTKYRMRRTQKTIRNNLINIFT